MRLETLLNRDCLVGINDLPGDINPSIMEEVIQIKLRGIQYRLKQLITLVLIRPLEHLANLNQLLQYLGESLMMTQLLNELLVLKYTLKHNQHVLVTLHVFHCLQLNGSLNDLQYHCYLVQGVYDGTLLREHCLDVGVVT